MDLIFIGLAVACALLAGGRSPFLWLIAAEFAVSAAWIWLPSGDAWWFLSYAVQNCAFAWGVMQVRHPLAREYAGTLIAAAALATAVFIEYRIGGAAIYGARPALMAWICIYQLWLAASGAGLIDGSPWRACRGAVHRCYGRSRGAGVDYSSRYVDRGV